MSDRLSLPRIERLKGRLHFVVWLINLRAVA